MAIDISVEGGKKVKIKATLAQVWDYLNDYEEQMTNADEVEEFTKLKVRKYHWGYSSVGVVKWTFAMEYDGEYYPDKKKNRIEWRSVKGSGNAEVEGFFQLKKLGSNETEMEMWARYDYQLPFPKLAGPAVKPVVKNLTKSGLSSYVDKIKKSIEAK
jgi:uncharacterized membrane protein